MDEQGGGRPEDNPACWDQESVPLEMEYVPPEKDSIMHSLALADLDR